MTESSNNSNEKKGILSIVYDKLRVNIFEIDAPSLPTGSVIVESSQPHLFAIQQNFVFVD